MFGFARPQTAGGGVSLGALSHMPGGGFDLFLASLFINILALALPLTLLQVYDRILPNTAEGTLILLVTGVGVALMLEAWLRLARSYVSGWMAARFEHMTGCSAIERLLSAGVTEFEKHGSGVHLERLSALNILKEYYAGQAIIALCDMPFAFIYLAAIAYLAGHLVIVPIILITLFTTVALFVGRRLKHSLENRMNADDRRYSFIIEVLGGIHTVKGLAMEEQMLRRYERLQEACADSNHAVALRSSHAASVGALFSQLTLFCVVGYGATFVIDGVLTVGGLAASTMLAGRSMQPLQRAVGIWTRFQSVTLARNRLRDLFSMRSEAPAGLPHLPPVRGAVELSGVGFNYGTNRDGEALPTVFEGVTMRIEPGEAVGISGANASGKSTLLYLMMGALRPVAGSIRIDGHDISEYDPISVRSQVAYLPQEGILFNGTLMENITMWREDKDDDALDIAKLLGLDSVVAHMPMGYDTKVGDGAADSLPRGVKQRIAIARALVGKPRIILFDEANTAMDSAGDAMLRGLLMRLKGRITLVLVTPRPSLLSLADRIYDIEGTRVRERGQDGSQLTPNPPPVAGVTA